MAAPSPEWFQLRQVPASGLEKAVQSPWLPVRIPFRLGGVAAGNDLFTLVERGLLGEVVLAVQLRNIGRDGRAACVNPGAPADGVAGVHGGGEILAMAIGAFEVTEDGAPSQANASHEEAHLGLLRPGRGGEKQSEYRSGEKSCHGFLP